MLVSLFGGQGLRAVWWGHGVQLAEPPPYARGIHVWVQTGPSYEAATWHMGWA